MMKTVLLIVLIISLLASGKADAERERERLLWVGATQTNTCFDFVFLCAKKEVGVRAVPVFFLFDHWQMLTLLVLKQLDTQLPEQFTEDLFPLSSWDLCTH